MENTDKTAECEESMPKIENRVALKLLKAIEDSMEHPADVNYAIKNYENFLCVVSMRQEMKARGIEIATSLRDANK